MVRISFLLAMLLHYRYQRQLLVAPLSLRESLFSFASFMRERRITCRALQHPSMSRFMTVFGFGCNHSLIALIEFDHFSFRYLLRIFEPNYYSYTPYSADGRINRLPPNLSKRGRQRTLSELQSLALLLIWGRSRGSEFILYITFGVIGSIPSFSILSARRNIVRVLSKDRYIAVRMPTANEVGSYQAAILAKYPLTPTVYAVADGLKITLEQSGDVVTQNIFDSGWTHEHYVGNVFVFSPSGLIICCALNAPGSMYDSIIVEFGSVYTKLRDFFDSFRDQCVVDSAFLKGNHPYLIKSAQNYVSDGDEDIDISIARQATAVRQASKWYMRAPQDTFPRMKDRMLSEERGKRRKILESSVFLFNVGTRLGGMNQILSTLMPHLSIEANHFLSNNS